MIMQNADEKETAKQHDGHSNAHHTAKNSAYHRLLLAGKAVANATNGFDVFSAAAKLCTKRPHMYIHCATFAVKLIAPDLRQQLITGVHPVPDAASSAAEDQIP